MTDMGGEHKHEQENSSGIGNLCRHISRNVYVCFQSHTLRLLTIDNPILILVFIATFSLQLMVLWMCINFMVMFAYAATLITTLSMVLFKREQRYINLLFSTYTQNLRSLEEYLEMLKKSSVKEN